MSLGDQLIKMETNEEAHKGLKLGHRILEELCAITVTSQDIRSVSVESFSTRIKKLIRLMLHPLMIILKNQFLSMQINLHSSHNIKNH